MSANSFQPGGRSETAQRKVVLRAAARLLLVTWAGAGEMSSPVEKLTSASMALKRCTDAGGLGVSEGVFVGYLPPLPPFHPCGT